MTTKPLDENMHIEITKYQHRNLVRLKNYFKRVTWDCINQEGAVMSSGVPDPKRPCCFGAHFTGCFRREIWPLVESNHNPSKHTFYRRDIMDMPHYHWSIYFKEFIGISDYVLVHHGASEIPFGIEKWPNHPRTVLERILKNVTIK